MEFKHITYPQLIRRKGCDKFKFSRFAACLLVCDALKFRNFGYASRRFKISVSFKF
jgi:hypothetical protein